MLNHIKTARKKRKKQEGGEEEHRECTRARERERNTYREDKKQYEDRKMAARSNENTMKKHASVHFTDMAFPVSFVSFFLFNIFYILLHLNGMLFFY